MIQGQQEIYQIYHVLHIVDCSVYHEAMKEQQSKTKKTKIALKTIWHASHPYHSLDAQRQIKYAYFILFFFLFFPTLVQWGQEKSLARTLKHHFDNKNK